MDDLPAQARRSGGSSPEGPGMACGQQPCAPPCVERLACEHEELLDVQRQLGAAHELLAGLLDAIPVALLLVDRQAMLLRANAQARQWLGLAADAPRTHGRRLLEMLDGAQRATLLRAIDQALRGSVGGDRGEPDAACPLALDAGDGTLRLVQAQARALPSRDGVQRAVLALLDREDRSRHARNRRLLTALLDCSEDLVSAVDVDGRLLFGNRALARLVGMQADEMGGRSRAEVLPLELAIAERASDERVLRDRLPHSLRSSFRGRDGQAARLFATRKFPIIDDGGELLGIGAVARDITADSQLRRDQRISELVFQHSSDAIIITDPALRILRVNPAFERLSGFRQASVLGRKPSILRSGRQSPGFYRRMWHEIGEVGHWAGELTNCDARGEDYRVWVSISVLRDEDQALAGYMAVQTDMTALCASLASIEQLSNFDALTGLPNRTLLMDRLQQMIRSAARRRQCFAVLFLDLDHFKDVNDSLGHAVGDQLLKRVSQWLKRELRSDDTVARIGGDEFVVLLPETQAEAALQVADKLMQALGRPADLPQAVSYPVSLSIGLAVYPLHGEQAEVLLQHADTAMYAAKSAGRGRVTLYEGAMSERLDWQFRMRNDLRLALGPGSEQLELFLQPKFRLSDGCIVGAEGLIRWHREAGAPPLLPGAFLPALEQQTLLRQLDEWVLAEGIRLLSAWQRRGLLQPGFCLSVNQTVLDLESADWLPRVAAQLEQAGLPEGSLEIELTENILAQPDTQVLHNLERMRGLGISLAIDDFGTGYSSLAYLQRLPVSMIKIDRAFVRDMVDNPSNRSLVQMIVALANSLGHHTIAEGVETQAQRSLLLQLGCECGQGYLVSPAVPSGEFERRFLAALEAGDEAPTRCLS